MDNNSIVARTERLLVAGAVRILAVQFQVQFYRASGRSN